MVMLVIEDFTHREKGEVFRVMLQCGKQRLSRLASTWDEAMKAAREVGSCLNIDTLYYNGKKVAL